MNNKHLNVEIRHAELKHIPGMLAVCAQNLLSDPKPTEIELNKTGFLIHQLTEEAIKVAILNRKEHIVLVATEDESVLAYALGKNVTELGPKIRTALIASSKEVERVTQSEKVFFYRQAAKKVGVHHVGLQISKAMFNEMKRQGYQYNLSVIVHHPIPNTKSIRFHAQFGFQCVGTLTMNHYTFGVYLTRL